MSHSISFGTDGWRAIIADQFTFANVERVAYATGLYVKNHYYRDGNRPPVLVGYDTRFLADKFAERVAQVLIGMGVEAKITARDVPTPVIAWATQVEPTAGALQLTASHNPPEYCGIKYIPDYAGPATNEITDELARLLEHLPEGYECLPVDVPVFDPLPNYFDAMAKRIDWKRIKSAHLRVVFDPIYGTSRDYLDAILKQHSVTVKPLRNWRDPLFGGGMPEPKAQYLKEMIDIMRTEKHDVGCATDGDADRFAVIDEKGTYYSPNMMLCLITRHLVKNHGLKGTIVRTVATTHLLNRLAQMYGLEVVETPVGFKYIGEEMRARDVLIGGEESGGMSVKGHIPEKDGILSNLLTIEMIAYEGKPLSEIWQDLIKECGMEFHYRRADLMLTPQSQLALIEHMKSRPFESIGSHKIQRIERKDGLKFYIDENNWILVRPSGTEPLFRLYVESTDGTRADDLMKSFRIQVQAIADSLVNRDQKVEAKA